MKSSSIVLTRRLASTRASGGPGGAKFIRFAVETTAAGAEEVSGCATYDGKFRRQLENTIAGSKNILNYVIGVEEPPAPRIKDLRRLQFLSDPKIAPKPFDSETEAQLVEKSIRKEEKLPEDRRNSQKL